MYRVLAKQELAPQIKLFKVYAPDIAEKAKPGQFVIIRIDEKGERIPLTVADWGKDKRSITLIFQEVGASTRKLGTLEVGDEILNMVGPLGNSNDAKHHSSVAVVCGGVGTAAAYPIAKTLKEEGNQITSIVGAKTKEMLILENEMKKVSDRLFISTDDGSKGRKGFVSDVLKKLIENGCRFSAVYAIGPPLMMKAVCDVTRPCCLKTIVSLNPIMVDGMGMCGACRVSVRGQTKFACIDGPLFNGHQVDFDELCKRLKMYQPEERFASQFQETIGAG
jgi:ferredoxin--NADP+ reductase